MADEFSFTDSDDDRAVEDVLSQAKDLSVLEQIAAINCSSLSTDNLPSHLETRFRKLKSLPSATATATSGSRFPPSKSKSFTPRSGGNSVDFERVPDLGKCSLNSSPAEYSDGNRDGIKGTDSKSKLKLKSKSKSNSKLKSKSRTHSSDSRSDSWNLTSPESRSVSPVRRGIGCLWWSPKKEKRKEGKENRSWGSDYDVEFVKTFSVKEQKNIMRKAMKEEERINKEAEKIVEWAKQASARMMDASSIVDDELFTDLEDTK